MKSSDPYAWTVADAMKWLRGKQRIMRMIRVGRQLVATDGFSAVAKPSADKRPIPKACRFYREANSVKAVGAMLRVPSGRVVTMKDPFLAWLRLQAESPMDRESPQVSIYGRFFNPVLIWHALKPSKLQPKDPPLRMVFPRGGLEPMLVVGTHFTALVMPMRSRIQAWPRDSR